MSTVVAMNSEEFMRKRFNDIMANDEMVCVFLCRKEIYNYFQYI